MININSLSTNGCVRRIVATSRQSASFDDSTHRRCLLNPEGLPRGARQALFITLAAFCLTPWVSPSVALALGAMLALTLENPFAPLSKKVSAKLLQVCVVLLGFGMDLPVVVRTGLQGFGLAAATVATTLGLGWALGKRLRIDRKISALISAGTAVCGGSAIAAVGSVIGVGESEISVAMGTVFILNAAALYAFPVVGHALGLTQLQFGTWAGIAIHDISSVVGASAHYGLDSLHTATVVKLSRALWIIPLGLGAAAICRANQVYRQTATQLKPEVQVPWFIGFFLLASVARSFVPGVAAIAPVMGHIASTGLTLTLFLIGAGLSAKTLRALGWRPFLQGVLLWLFISVVSLAAIVRFV
ncbi:MAG: putative sulfate exporter family transporter [Verrucomicrobia bacterium]|nr:putative sulfate exporter family transporter [Verrucomicrobiota bacterium]